MECDPSNNKCYCRVCKFFIKMPCVCKKCNDYKTKIVIDNIKVPDIITLEILKKYHEKKLPHDPKKSKPRYVYDTFNKAYDKYCGYVEGERRSTECKMNDITTERYLYNRLNEDVIKISKLKEEDFVLVCENENENLIYNICNFYDVFLTKREHCNYTLKTHKNNVEKITKYVDEYEMKADRENDIIEFLEL